MDYLQKFDKCKTSECVGLLRSSLNGGTQDAFYHSILEALGNERVTANKLTAPKEMARALRALLMRSCLEGGAGTLPEEVLDAVLAIVNDQSSETHILYLCSVVIQQWVDNLDMAEKSRLGITVVTQPDTQLHLGLHLLSMYSDSRLHISKASGMLLTEHLGEAPSLYHSLTWPLILGMVEGKNAAEVTQNGDGYIMATLTKASAANAPELNPRTPKQNKSLEPDGTLANDFWTVLNISTEPSSAQFGNMASFSIMDRWIAVRKQVPEGLKRCTVQYVHRLLDQIESYTTEALASKVFDPSRHLFIESVLVQCLQLLVLLSSKQTRASFTVTSTATKVRKLFETLTNIWHTTTSPGSGLYYSGTVMLAFLTYFVHTTPNAENLQPFLERCWGCPWLTYAGEPGFTQKLFQFCLDFTPILAIDTTFYDSIYPIAFQLYAKELHGVSAELHKLLTSFIGPDNFIDVLMRILDLPLLAHAVRVPDLADLSAHCQCVLQVEMYMALLSRSSTSCQEVWQSQYPFIPSQWPSLESAVDASSPLAVASSQHISDLLAIYFQCVIPECDYDMQCTLVEAILWRCACLLVAPDQRHAVETCLLTQAQTLIARSPAMLGDDRIISPLSHFLTRDHMEQEHITIWCMTIMADNAHMTGCDSTNQAKILGIYFDLLDAFAYGWCTRAKLRTVDGNGPEPDQEYRWPRNPFSNDAELCDAAHGRPTTDYHTQLRVLLMLMHTITSLASNHTSLIDRALAILMWCKEHHSQAVQTQATFHIALLQQPLMASHVFGKEQESVNV